VKSALIDGEIFQGLTDDRKWYLFESVRPYVLTEAGKKEICPPPNCQKGKMKDFKQNSTDRAIRKMKIQELRDLGASEGIEVAGKTKPLLMRELISLQNKSDKSEGCFTNCCRSLIMFSHVLFKTYGNLLWVMFLNSFH
tara:strand:- start:757 stop:1173 length:417 start_codon:yes stop_codon:yes gene_type:complete